MEEVKSMNAKIQELLGHKVGDIMTLSDLQTQAEFDDTSVDFKIDETRLYTVCGMFTYHAYIASAPTDTNDRKYMLLIRTVDDDADLMLFYLDQEGDIVDFAEHILTEDKEDFLKEFTVELDGEDITWVRKKPTTFGVKTTTSAEGDDQRTLAEYGVSDDTQDATNNKHAFLEWCGDEENGFVEMWYGCEIQPHEVQIYEVTDD